MTPFSRAQLAATIDHTLLKPNATRAQIAALCDEALEHRFAAVCLAPRHVEFAAKRLEGSGVAVATVAGFPNGDTFSEIKAQEAYRATRNGATEIDMVIPIGAALEGDWETVSREIELVVGISRGATVKVILENAYLNKAQIVRACECARDAGAHYVKTSTGFAASGAKVEDVALMKRTVGEACKVKAAGGIRDLATALAMLEAGASRLGMSASVAVLEEIRA